MTESISGDAEAIYSIIRAHPGIEGRAVGLGLGLGLDSHRLTLAIGQLLDLKWIVVKTETLDKPTKEGKPIKLRLYSRV